MLSFGWSEIALVVVIVIIVIGPKEIPNLLRQLGKFSKSVKKISREFKNSINDLAEEGDIKDIKKSISKIKNIKNDLDLSKELKKEINSINEVAGAIKDNIKDIDSDIKGK